MQPENPVFHAAERVRRLNQPGTEAGEAVALTDFSALVGSAYLDRYGGVDRGTVLIYNGLVTQFFDGFESGDTSAWSSAVP